MKTIETPKVSEGALNADVLHAVRYYLGGRRGLVGLATIAVVAGLAFNWGWLVAAGIAPLLIAVLPCAAMCALGLCVSRMTGRACSTDATSQKAIEHDRMNQITGNRHKTVQAATEYSAESVPASREATIKPARRG